jgi:N-acetylmuramoyl-L-alanine amidase-like protein
MIDSLAHECRTGIAAYHHEGERSQRSIRYIVLHSTEGGTAKSTAEWFANPASGGSANIVVDDISCYRCLGDNIIPWGAPPLNTFGFHIEQCGYAAWSRARWLLHYNTLRRSAYKAALRVKWYGIPIKVPTVDELKRDYEASMADGRPPVGGIVTHRLVDETFHQSDHTDPGADFPLDVWLKLVRHYAA